MGVTMSDISVGRDVNGSLIITGSNNLIVTINTNHDDQRQSEIEEYLRDYVEALKEVWQKASDQSVPRASAYLWKKLASGEKEFTSTIHATSNGATVELKDPDIKLRAAQEEIASQHGQPVNATSQTGEELIKNLSKLVNDDLDESSKNKLTLSLFLPDIDAERLIHLEIAYRKKAYFLKVGLQTLAGEPIYTLTNITLFNKAAPRREVCKYTMRGGQIVQIPEIEPSPYNLQIVSKETQQLFWKMDLQLSSIRDRLM